MKIAYYPETDSMYIDFSAKESVESKEVSPGIVLDYQTPHEAFYSAIRGALTT